MRFFFLFLIFIPFLGFSSQLDSLKQADEFFSSGNYTEAYAIYKNIFEKGYSTPAMLLKMAFIQEGSDEYAKSIYFLEKYKKITNDNLTNRQLDKLVKEHALDGFKASASDEIRLFISKHRTKIQIGLLLVMILLLVATLRSKQKLVFGLLQVMVVSLLIGCSLIQPNKYGILSQDQTILRKEPSTGADISESIPEKGHKIRIISQEKEIWTKVAWNGEIYYLRNSYLDII